MDNTITSITICFADGRIVSTSTGFEPIIPPTESEIKEVLEN